MRTSLRNDLTTAIKARDRVAVAALRSALAAIENAEALPVEEPTATRTGNEHVVAAAIGAGAAEAERRHLTDNDIRSIVENEIEERSSAAGEYERAGRGDAAERLRAEAAVLSRHLDR